MLYRLFYGAFVLVAAYCLARYFNHVVQVAAFPYDWGASDGDHLNFAHRIAKGLQIYFPLEAGQVLSIYNPLYHAFVAAIGAGEPSMNLARSISLIFWILIPLTAFLVYRKEWGYSYSALAAIFILLPSEPYMLLDIVNVTPDSMMGFLFIATLILAERYANRLETPWRSWLWLGAVAALCFLAKQQGIVAIACVTLFLLARRVPLKNIGWMLFGFLFVFSIAYVYLQAANSGQYLQATIFGLKQIMPYKPELAESRLYAFMISHNAAVTVTAVLALVTVALRMSKLTVWQVSFVLHLFYLLQVLGNGGGGPNYFLTMWITMVLMSVGLIASVLKGTGKISTPYFSIADSLQGQVNWAAKILLVGIFISISVGTVSIHRQLNASVIPSPELEKLMEDYYQAVGKLVQERPSARILTNRNIGALVANGANVENEGSTMFQYAWAHGEIFQPDVVISAVRAKQYDLIVTGIQPYPKIIGDEITKNYRVVLQAPEILSVGGVGFATIYSPK